VVTARAMSDLRSAEKAWKDFQSFEWAERYMTELGATKPNEIWQTPY